MALVELQAAAALVVHHSRCDLPTDARVRGYCRPCHDLIRRDPHDRGTMVVAIDELETAMNESLLDAL